jgi:hypothetical protein
MPNSLVIGGTGMLRDVCLYLADSGYDVIVVARTESELQNLYAETLTMDGNILPRRSDYRVIPMFKSKLMDDIRRVGDISLAVTWIHSDAPEASEAVAELIGATDGNCRVFDILGSPIYNPENLVEDRRDYYEQFGNISYNRVLLGYKVENGESRWLTDEEIAAGVRAAIESDRKETLVGQVEPWGARP